MTAVAYIRVSRRAQDDANQRSAIERAASARGDAIVDWRAENLSARTMGARGATPVTCRCGEENA